MKLLPQIGSRVCLVKFGLALLSCGAVLTSVQAQQNAPRTLDSQANPQEVIVVHRAGKVQSVPDGNVPVQLDDPLSSLVEKFLRRTILGYEEMKNPTRYSPLSYIKPGDDLGMIDRNGAARAVKAEEVPESVRKALSVGTDPK